MNPELNMTDAQPASTTFLDNSKVPTYDDFSRENVVFKKPWFQLAHLLTDDESEDDEDEATIINKKRNFKVIASPCVEKRPVLSSVQQQSPRTPQPAKPRLLLQQPKPKCQTVDQKTRHVSKINKEAPSSPDYVLCAHKETQTSFVESPPSPDSIVHSPSKLDTQVSLTILKFYVSLNEYL